MSENEQSAMHGRNRVDPSSLPEFDERMIRRATRWGIIKTAANVIVFLLAASLALQLLMGFVLSVGGKRDRLEQVVIPGLLVANPEYASYSSGCCNTGYTHMTGYLEIQLRSPEPVPQVLILEPAQDLRGRFDPYSVSVPLSPLGTLVQGGVSISADHEREVLASLPDNMQASAVVLFERPLDQAGVDAILARLGVASEAAVLFDVPQDARWVGSPSGTKRRIGWRDSSFSAFRDGPTLCPHPMTRRCTASAFPALRTSCRSRGAARQAW